LEETIYLSTLFDYYGVLLTDKQRLYFEDYYFNNLTLSEMSINNNISRNAVHKQIKDATLKLKQYEEKLKLYEKSDSGTDDYTLAELLEQIKDEKIKKEIKELI